MAVDNDLDTELKLLIQNYYAAGDDNKRIALEAVAAKVLQAATEMASANKRLSGAGEFQNKQDAVIDAAHSFMKAVEDRRVAADEQGNAAGLLYTIITNKIISIGLKEKKRRTNATSFGLRGDMPVEDPNHFLTEIENVESHSVNPYFTDEELPVLRAAIQSTAGRKSVKEKALNALYLFDMLSDTRTPAHRIKSAISDEKEMTTNAIHTMQNRLHNDLMSELDGFTTNEKYDPEIVRGLIKKVIDLKAAQSNKRDLI